MACSGFVCLVETDLAADFPLLCVEPSSPVLFLYSDSSERSPTRLGSGLCADQLPDIIFCKLF